MASAAFCTPKLSIHRVTAAADIATGNLTRVTLLEDITSSPEYASISGPPLNGRPYNGMRFPLADPDPFVLARENATRLQLPAAILMAAQLQTENDYFANNKFWEVSQEVYVSRTRSPYCIMISDFFREPIFLSLREICTLVSTLDRSWWRFGPSENAFS